MIIHPITRKEVCLPANVKVPSHLLEVPSLQPYFSCKPFFQISERAKITTCGQKESGFKNSHLAGQSL